MNTKTANNGLAVLLGGGPGDVGLMTIEGKKWLSRADTVIYDRLANQALLSLARGEAELIYVGKGPGRDSYSQEQINSLLVERVRAGQVVVRLKGGDPLIFGRGGEEADALAGASCAFRIVPGITAAIAAGAYAGVSLTDRRAAGTLAFVTGREDPAKGESSINFAALAGIDTVVFYMGVGRLGAIAESLISAGRDGATAAAIIVNASTARQRTIPATLATLSDRAAEANVQPPAIIIIGEVARMHEKLNWYESLPMFGRCVLVTRGARRSGRLGDVLAELGAEVIEAPAITIEGPANPEAVDSALGRLKSGSNFDWVVFTSPNGVGAFFGRLIGVALDARVFGSARIAAVGPATADALATKGLRADLTGDKFTTAALGEALIATGIEGKRILLARSDLAGSGLHEALLSAGGLVEELAVYRTVRPAALPSTAGQALQTGRVDWITFTSSSTVENFIALAGRDAISGCKLAAIGPVTAEALRRAGFEPTTIAEPHTIDALAGAILAAELQAAHKRT